MLLAVALSFRPVGAMREVTFVHDGIGRVLIVEVTITLLLRRPSVRMILARRLRAFPRSGVRLLVFPVG